MKKNKCIDCGKAIWHESIKCRDCWKIWSKIPENNGFYGRKHKQSSLKKISKNHADISGDNNPMKLMSSRIKMSINNSGEGNAMFGRKGILSPRFGKIAAHGTRIYYKDICFRSSWEVAYAKWLDKQTIDWQYEDKTFNLGNCTYTPDFYLPKSNEYIEIKGFWRDKSKEKINLFKKIYSDKKLIILFKKDLKEKNII